MLLISNPLQGCAALNANIAVGGDLNLESVTFQISDRVWCEGHIKEAQSPRTENN